MEPDKYIRSIKSLIILILVINAASVYIAVNDSIRHFILKSVRDYYAIWLILDLSNKHQDDLINYFDSQDNYSENAFFGFGLATISLNNHVITIRCEPWPNDSILGLGHSWIRKFKIVEEHQSTSLTTFSVMLDSQKYTLFPGEEINRKKLDIGRLLKIIAGLYAPFNFEDLNENNLDRAINESYYVIESSISRYDVQMPILKLNFPAPTYLYLLFLMCFFTNIIIQSRFTKIRGLKRDELKEPWIIYDAKTLFQRGTVYFIAAIIMVSPVIILLLIGLDGLTRWLAFGFPPISIGAIVLNGIIIIMYMATINISRDIYDELVKYVKKEGVDKDKRKIETK